MAEIRARIAEGRVGKGMKEKRCKLCMVAMISLLLLTVTACNEPSPSPQPPKPTATAPIAATATAMPTAIFTPTPETIPTAETVPQETNFQSSLTNYRITIPKEWRVFDPRNSDIDALFSSLDSHTDEGVIQALEEFRSAGGIEQVDFVAQSGEATWTVIVVPRNGLTLEDYLTVLAKQLGERILRRGIDTTIRPDGIPAATLQIAPINTAQTNKISYQVVHFDENAEHLIIHSFAAPQSDFDRYKTHFNSLVRAIEWLP